MANLTPEPMPTDPRQKMRITCAGCGADISFHKRTVYSNRYSYLCYRCAVKGEGGNDD